MTYLFTTIFIIYNYLKIKEIFGSSEEETKESVVHLPSISSNCTLEGEVICNDIACRKPCKFWSLDTPVNLRIRCQNDRYGKQCKNKRASFFVCTVCCNLYCASCTVNPQIVERYKLYRKITDKDGVTGNVASEISLIVNTIHQLILFAL